MKPTDHAASRVIRPEPLSKLAFEAFGDVLETDGVQMEMINFGNTQKFALPATLSIADGVPAQLSIYRSSAISLPFRIRLMERHPLGSQAFYPLHDRPFLVVVAAPGTTPVPENLRAFLTNGRQGVNIHPGVWHHYQLTLGQDSDYLVLDRAGVGENYQEHTLIEEVLLDI